MDHPPGEDYPAQLKRLRARLGLTQAALAKALGVSFPTINRWENGKSRPSQLSWNQLLKLAGTGEADRVAEPEPPPYPDTPPVLDFTASSDVVRALVEGERLSFGHLANPAFATEIARIDPLPHQRIAVYDHMLKQSRFRFLLADDAGAGKTIMTGLYIREMLSRRLLKRVLIVPPAGLVGNWQREFSILFSLQFDIVSGSDARDNNPFTGPSSDHLIVSLDTLARERVFARLQEDKVEPYELVVFDEAHKLSCDQGSDFSVRKTDRYRLAEAIAGVHMGDRAWQLPWHAHHLLLLTATPHMGKDYPYYALWRLLEPEVLTTPEAFDQFPFEHRKQYFIRRIKEEMVKLTGEPLYPRRIADTLAYGLTQGDVSEQRLYDETTEYLRHVYNKAKLLNQSAARLAMGVFQRRLASSTYAVLCSFERRIGKLSAVIDDVQAGRITMEQLLTLQRRITEDDDVLESKTADDEGTENGREENEMAEDKLLQGVIAISLADLVAERQQVEQLRDLAQRVHDAGHESKFDELRTVITDPKFAGEKLIVFTEHRDTLDFLVRRLGGMGYTGQIAMIHGGMHYTERQEQVERFRKPGSEGGARFMICTDAAAEGINLQFCWIMINYDVPWNPARLEQRMGRIHRYGQKHDPVIILNFVAPSTREGRVLILIDEVLMYVREKVAADARWKDRIINFFQYLTQAATKVDRCCVVASLLASDPVKGDSFGRQLQGKLYDIFQRQREEAVEPVVKEDVAELLRRRFFTPESIKDRNAFRPHVQAALKGIFDIDEQTRKQGGDAEERYLKSYPFHPDLTEVFYTKWTQMNRFQKARGVLRTFALALREAETWDSAPLVGPGILLNAPERDGLSEAMRELVTVADTEEHEGRRPAWTGIIAGELGRARDLQRASVGLRFREVEQAVVATFLHSQPIGQSARSRDLLVLLGATRPDRIELEKGLMRWAQASFWLDDQYTAVGDNQLPSTWRLGNRPNLTQMHAVAAGRVSDDVVRARLLDEIDKAKSLTAGASAAGVRVHTLPSRPRDIEDDGQFHFAILAPGAASDSGKPSPEAKRYLDETMGAEKPRVYRNAVLLLTPSKDGVEVASARVRDYLAWEQVRTDLKEQEKDGEVDVARMQTLAINIDKAKGRIPEAVKQAYCIVVTVSEHNEVQAFKINVTDEPHFNIIKNDSRSRVQDSSITAEALLPDGPYSLWRPGETSRRVRDLSGAFAQLPHLPKMLKAQAILDTLADGCEQGAFVLRLTRPDGSFRTWWRTRPDDAAMNDPALELVLPEAAELGELPSQLLLPANLPELWRGDEIAVQAVLDYFGGNTVVQVQRDGYMEPVSIPKTGAEVINKAITAAVEGGALWLVSSPASVLAEPIPAGVLTSKAILRQPPAMIAAAEILPENLPDAWSDGKATALSIATALSQKFCQTMPWKTVKDVITASINARFAELDPTWGDWPCDYPAAQSIKLKIASGPPGRQDVRGIGPARPSTCLVAHAELEPSEIQDLAEIIPNLLELKAQFTIPLTFHVQIELGDGKERPSEEAAKEINKLLKELKDGFELQ